MAEGRADALRPGHRLHVYTVAEILGAGGFGITYRAVEDFTKRQVAIKEFFPNIMALRAGDGVGVRPISPSSGGDFEWGLDRFRNEATTLYALRHPNIVPVLQYFEANGTGYLVMEFQEGATLGDLLKRDATLDPSELEDILEPLLGGLAAIHAKGFLHRDVKPDNIFIRTDGAPLLLDFGAARQAIGERSASLTTIISEGYAPFEQYESGGNQGAWTDIYAFGATLYRCITGVKPMPAPSRVMALMQKTRDPLAPVSAAARARYGEPIVTAMEAALAVSAAARPQSIEAFRAMLRGEAHAETVVPAITTPGEGTIALPGAEPIPEKPARVIPKAPPPARRPRPPAAGPAREAAVPSAEPARRGLGLVWAAFAIIVLTSVSSMLAVAVDSASQIGFAVVGTYAGLHAPLLIGASLRWRWARPTLAVLMLTHALPAIALLLELDRLHSTGGAFAFLVTLSLGGLVAGAVTGAAILVSVWHDGRREQAAAIVPPPANAQLGFWLFIGACAAALAGAGAGIAVAYEIILTNRDRDVYLAGALPWIGIMAIMLAAAGLRQRWGAVVGGLVMAAAILPVPILAGYYAELGKVSGNLANHRSQNVVSLCILGFSLAAAFGLVLWHARSIRAWQRRGRDG
jgi:serine/threonine protein kinase